MRRILFIILCLLLTLVLTPTLLFAQDDLQLTENFESGRSQIAFDYPEGWFVVELYDGGLDIANNQEMLLRRNRPEPGQVQIGVFTSYVLDNVFSLPETATAEDVMDVFTAQILALMPEPIPTPIVEKRGGKSILRLTLQDGEYHSSFLVVPTDDQHFTVLALDSHKDDMEALIANALAIAESMTFVEVSQAEKRPYTQLNLKVSTEDLTQTYTSNDEELSFRLPGEWVVEESKMSIIVASSEDAGFPSPNSGEVVVLLTVANRKDIEGISEDANSLDYIRTLRTSVHNMPVSFSINGIEAANSTIRNLPDQVGGAMMVVQPEDDTFVVLMAYTAPGEWPEVESEILALLSTIEYEPS